MSQSPFYSTKRFGPISTAHRQFRANSHCKYIHGYGRYVEIVFAGSALDDKGWIVDFGDLRHIKNWLDDQWDHRLLVAHDDPMIDALVALDKAEVLHLNIMPAMYGPGMEQSCHFVFDYVDTLIRTQSNDRCWVESVRVWEHEGNSAIYKPNNT